MIKRVVGDNIPGSVRIVGQISNFTDRSHWFFSLKDEDAQMRCVCFASVASRIRLRPQDGMEVVCTGRIDYFESQGQLQLYVNRMEPVGLGSLEIQFRELCEKLRQLGYFDVDRKKPMPAVAQRIAVVTSRSAAALQDVIDTTRRRWPGCELFHYDVRVQGEAAAGEIAQAVNALSKQGDQLGIDAIILTRGGGSIEDLWAFNERVVADAVFKCRLPIVAAIGHETDTTVAELVADARCATPTQAAMTLVPDKAALAHQIHQIDQRMKLMLRRQVQVAEHRLAAVVRHPIFRKPTQMVETRSTKLSELKRQLVTALSERRQKAKHDLQLVASRLGPAMVARLKSEQSRVAAMQKQLNAIGPQQVLERGYSYTLDEKGKLIRSVDDVTDGQAISTVVTDGRIKSIVSESNAGTKPVKRKSKTKSKRKSKTDSPGLFD